jgi:tRNA pseudouridine55 synthase
VDGLLVIDKPAGPTSHDIVATARRVLRERRIGHTGTLDPMASGVLPLVLGRATRLAQFLTSNEKEYDAVVRLGVTTDTGDRLGAPQGAEYRGAWPTHAEVEHALERFRGTFVQQPPAYSAKKIEGRRSHRLARARARDQVPETGEALRPAPVTVTTSAVDLVGVDGPLVSLRIVCTAGFYVRSLAADLGEALGTGGHLSALRRTRSGSRGLGQAMTLDALVTVQRPEDVVLIGLDEMLPGMPAVVLTPEGLKRAVHGHDVGPQHASSPWPLATGTGAGTESPGAYVRLQGPAGDLVAIADHSGPPGLLHPAVVLK